jgi:hypothetical protein
MSPNRSLALIALLFLLGCATARPPGTFADAGPLHANTLRLNADGTFSYEAWSDGGGMFWRAEGTWQWLEGDRFATEIAKVTLGSEEFPPLARYQVWRVTGRGVLRESTLFKPRSE